MVHYGPLWSIMVHRNWNRNWNKISPASVLTSEWSFVWHGFMFPMLFCSNSARKSRFSEIQYVCDGPMDRRTDGQNDRFHGPHYESPRLTHTREAKARIARRTFLKNLILSPKNVKCLFATRERSTREKGTLGPHRWILHLLQSFFTSVSSL